MKIGFSGMSTSGKSTVAKLMAKEYNAKVYHSDRYFKSDAPRCHFHGRSIRNLDLPAATAWDLLYEDLSEDESPLIFIDSFQLHYDESIASQLDAVIQFEYKEEDFQVALNRRVIRSQGMPPPENYHDLDPKRNRLVFSALYFEEIVWSIGIAHPEYWKFTEEEDKIPILTLSATDPLDLNIELSREFIRQFLISQK